MRRARMRPGDGDDNQQGKINNLSFNIHNFRSHLSTENVTRSQSQFHFKADGLSSSRKRLDITDTSTPRSSSSKAEVPQFTHQMGQHNLKVIEIDLLCQPKTSFNPRMDEKKRRN
ncbi:hypothetical protein llap_18048 [Limosa lapponica baueri]|uniref:Uncharacterized protein n=1 Tax=Limosa lapponica baueri TaxID=1758121 RepID=A0A2I0TCW4_LIMLA|nr:hypothetical protein llap_18048 [Limosa lapponica baueri]